MSILEGISAYLEALGRWAGAKAFWALGTAFIVPAMMVFAWRLWTGRRLRAGAVRPPGPDVDPQPARVRRPRLALLVHGLGGDAQTTWGQFPALLAADPEIAKLYDVDCHTYPTEIAGTQPSFATLAKGLRTEIATRFADYGEIAIIAHSQGGLIARQYIADAILAAGGPTAPAKLPVTRLITYATPHLGTMWANAASATSLAGNHVASLAIDSEFLLALASAWGQAQAENRVLTRYVVGAKDAIVGPSSAGGPQWRADFDVVDEAGHGDIVKPADANATSFLIARNFLLSQDGPRPGAAPDYRPPSLRYNYLDPALEQNRFVYGARAIPMLGRETETERLDAFLAGPEQPFRWMILHGSGGMGKSRLALELCRAHATGWHTGFLDRDAKEPDWLNWQPMLPTLIVLDYAALDTERTGRILHALSGRSALDGTVRLRAPVRVLLVERTGGGDWLDRALGKGVDGKRALETRAAKDLPLVKAEPWPIIQRLLETWDAKSVPPRDETLAALHRIDPEERPLFAYFLADAIAEGRAYEQFDGACLLEDVIARWRDKFWQPKGAGAPEERLLAVATMCGGLSRAVIEGLAEPRFPAWDPDRHPVIFATMTGRQSDQAVPPLEPDILGEHFSLSVLAAPGLSDDERLRLVRHGWQRGGLAMAQFSIRAHRDLPASETLPILRRPPDMPGEVETYWAMSAVDLMVDLPRRHLETARSFLADVRGVAQTRGEAVLWEQWANAATNLMIELPKHAPDRAEKLLADMRDVASKRDEAVLWELWANAATNLMVELPKRAPDRAEKLLADMRAVASERGEAVLWESWARANVSLMVSGLQLDQAAVAAVQVALRNAQAANDEAAMRKIMDGFRGHQIEALRARDPEHIRARYLDMARKLDGVESPLAKGLLAQAFASLLIEAAIGGGPEAAEACRCNPEVAAVTPAEVAVFSATTLYVAAGEYDAAEGFVDAFKAEFPGLAATVYAMGAAMMKAVTGQ